MAKPLSGSLIAAVVTASLSLLLPARAAPSEAMSRLQRAHWLRKDSPLPAAQRIARGVSYLQQELAHPTPRQPSHSYGARHIDSGTIQAALAMGLSYPGVRDPQALRRARNAATDPRLRDLLTVALGLTGQPAEISPLRRIARRHPIGDVRSVAVSALSELVEPADAPGRLHPRPPGPPLSAKTKAEIKTTLLACLNDPYERYTADCVMEEIRYPVRDFASRGLAKLGLRRKPLAGSRYEALLTDERGKPIRRIKTVRWNRPYRQPVKHSR